MYASALKSPLPFRKGGNLISLHLSVRRWISGNAGEPNCTRHGGKCLLSELETISISSWGFRMDTSYSIQGDSVHFMNHHWAPGCLSRQTIPR